MELNLAGKYLSKTGRYRSYRSMLFGTGLIGTAAIIGTGIMGGYVASSLAK